MFKSEKREARSTADFWAKVDKSGGSNACWNWTGYCNSHGLPYGMFGHVPKPAHRKAWTLLVGKIPDDLLVLHRCDNPRCCNPAHLFLGTQQDNRRDCREKGRTAKGAANGVHKFLAGSIPPPGQKRPHWKITPAQVAEIRARFAAGGVKKSELAREYCLSRSHVGMIIARQKWKDL